MAVRVEVVVALASFTETLLLLTVVLVMVRLSVLTTVGKVLGWLVTVRMAVAVYVEVEVAGGARYLVAIQEMAVIYRGGSWRTH